MRRVELHLVSPNDELSLRNGSAVLSVARALRAEAEKLGTQAVIGGSVGRLVDLPDTLGVLRKRQRSRTTSFVDPFAKAVGKPLSIPQFLPRALDGFTDIYCHNQPWIASELRRLAPTARLTLYVHNQLMNGAPRATKRTMLGRFDDVICVSDFVRNDLQHRVGMWKGHPRLRAVYNGVDSTRFDSSSRQEFDVTFVGRVIPAKGALEFAQAVNLVSHVRPVTVAFVGGQGFIPQAHSRYETRVRALLEQKNIRATFTGPVPPSEVPALMNRSRVIVVPSVWQDPCPLVALEALASRAALVATRVGGMQELEATGGGRFVPPRDAQAVATAVLGLLEDDAQRATVAEAGRVWAQRRSWAAVYAEVLAA